MQANRAIIWLFILLLSITHNFASPVTEEASADVVDQDIVVDLTGTSLSNQQDQQEQPKSPKMWIRHRGLIKVVAFLKKVEKEMANKKKASKAFIGIEQPDEFWAKIRQNTNSFKKLIRTSIKYAFLDVKPERREEVVLKIAGDEANPNSGAKNFKEMADAIYNWYAGLDKTVGGPDVDGYPRPYALHQKIKAGLVTEPIRKLVNEVLKKGLEKRVGRMLSYKAVNGNVFEHSQAASDKKSQASQAVHDTHVSQPSQAVHGNVSQLSQAVHGSPSEALLDVRSNLQLQLYDVGTGDGELSRDIFTDLTQDGFHVDMTLIDIDDCVNWTATASCTHKKEKEKPQKGTIKKLLYDGENLGEAIQKDFEQKMAKMEDGNGRRKEQLIVVTFNHSLHHWPNYRAQRKSMEQLAKVLPPGSIVVLKEHYNQLNDDQISLNHLLINFRNNLFHTPGPDPKSRELRPKEEAVSLMDHYVAESGAHNYISAFIMLLKLMARSNFAMMSFEPEDPEDSDRTVVYGFVKQPKTFGENSVEKGKGLSQEEHLAEGKKRKMGIDELSADRVLKKLRHKANVKNVKNEVKNA